MIVTIIVINEALEVVRPSGDHRRPLANTSGHWDPVASADPALRWHLASSPWKMPNESGESYRPAASSETQQWHAQNTKQFDMFDLVPAKERHASCFGKAGCSCGYLSKQKFSPAFPEPCGPAFQNSEGIYRHLILTWSVTLLLLWKAKGRMMENDFLDTFVCMQVATVWHHLSSASVLFVNISLLCLSRSRFSSRKHPKSQGGQHQSHFKLFKATTNQSWRLPISTISTCIALNAGFLPGLVQRSEGCRSQVAQASFWPWPSSALMLDQGRRAE